MNTPLRCGQCCKTAQEIPRHEKSDVGLTLQLPCCRDGVAQKEGNPKHNAECRYPIIAIAFSDAFSTDCSTLRFTMLRHAFGSCFRSFISITRDGKKGTPTFDSEFSASFFDMTCGNCKEIHPYTKFTQAPFA